MHIDRSAKNIWSPRDSRKLAEKYSSASPFQTALSLSFDWGIIALSIATMRWWPNAGVCILGTIAIASRQHALLVLMHEGSHGHFCSNRAWNDRICNWLTAWPLGVAVEGYRDHHWNHHRHTNTDLDPDWARKSKLPAWRFPKSRKKFFRDLLPYAGGLGALEILFAVKALGLAKNTFNWPRLLHTLLFAALFVFSPMALVKFWLAPYFLVLPLLMKVRSVVEHLGLPHEHALNGTRNILASPLERFLFGPHWNNLHLVHHLYPNVPWHKVPALQAALLADPNYAALAHQNTSYFWPSRHSVFADLTRTDILEMKKAA